MCMDIFVLLARSLYKFIFFLCLAVIIIINLLLLIASLVPRLIPSFSMCT